MSLSTVQWVYFCKPFTGISTINADKCSRNRGWSRTILLRSQWVKLHVVVVLISILVGETSFNACKLGVPFVQRGHVASYKVSVRKGYILHLKGMWKVKS